MIDIRYLGLTLIGVFLALAVGLMAGSALGSPDRRDAAYESIRGQFELLRGENQRVRMDAEEVRRRLASREDALRALLPTVVRDRLAGKPVAFILTGGIDERPFWGELEATLKLAGAEVGPIIRLPRTLRPLSPERRLEFARTLRIELSTRADEGSSEVGWLVPALYRPSGLPVLESLARELGCEVRLADLAPVRHVVLLSGPHEGDDRPVTELLVPELLLSQQAQDRRMSLTAAEVEDAGPSLVDYLGRRGIPTIDNVDSVSGQLALVLSLAGAPGRYGSKPGSSRAVPELSEP